LLFLSSKTAVAADCPTLPLLGLRLELSLYADVSTLFNAIMIHAKCCRWLPSGAVVIADSPANSNLLCFGSAAPSSETNRELPRVRMMDEFKWLLCELSLCDHEPTPIHATISHSHLPRQHCA
jgi:hypothetical protein